MVSGCSARVENSPLLAFNERITLLQRKENSPLLAFEEKRRPREENSPLSAQRGEMFSERKASFGSSAVQKMASVTASQCPADGTQSRSSLECFQRPCQCCQLACLVTACTHQSEPEYLLLYRRKFFLMPQKPPARQLRESGLRQTGDLKVSNRSSS
jgi:hypothetical protein